MPRSDIRPVNAKFYHSRNKKGKEGRRGRHDDNKGTDARQLKLRIDDIVEIRYGELAPLLINLKKGFFDCGSNGCPSSLNCKFKPC